MKLVAALLLPLIASVVSGAVLNKAMWHFGETINCVQPGVNPLKYDRYGCWCGFGGSGKAMDAVDECCHAHDKCWERSREQLGCNDLDSLPYLVDYDFTCSNKRVTCSGSNNVCAAAVCECDREAAHCFARSSYNPEYKYLDRNTYC